MRARVLRVNVRSTRQVSYFSVLPNYMLPAFRGRNALARFGRCEQAPSATRVVVGIPPSRGKIGLHAAPPGVFFCNKKYIWVLLFDPHPRAQKRRQTAGCMLCYGARNIASPQPQFGAYRLRAVWGEIGLHAAPPGVIFQNKIYICALVLNANTCAQKAGKMAARIMC